MAVLKYQKPKILLVDLPENALTRLQAAGLNARAGSFGRPYLVGDRGDYVPVIPNGQLPNYDEQEIVVIDLSDPEPLEEEQQPQGGVSNHPGYYLSGSPRIVDPRPLLSWMWSNLGDRILEHRGLFVIFAHFRSKYTYYLGETDSYSARLSSSAPIVTDNWSFLSSTSHRKFTFDLDMGTEVFLADEDFVISDLLRKHLKGISFSTSIRTEYRTRPEDGLPCFCPLLVSKYDEVVGGALFLCGSRGTVLILPQIDDKPGFLEELFQGVLPATHPHLFPEHEGERWVHRSEYEHPAVMSLHAHKLEIQRNAKEAEAVVEREIEKERTRLGFLHGLLTKTGGELVADVKTALEFVGFQQVIDVDAAETGRANQQEDLQIMDREPALLVEVKGLTWLPREANTLQVTKFVLRRMREWRPSDVHGITLVNHQKGLLPLERDNQNVFTVAQIGDAEANGTGLMTTWDLFRLIRGMELWGWEPGVIQVVFYQKGRIGLLPGHYRPLGKIAHFYPKVKVGDQEVRVASVQLDGELSLRVGDTVGYVLPGGFEEERVGSLQVDHEKFEEAKPGQKVGYVTRMERSDLPDGTAVYLIGSAV